MIIDCKEYEISVDFDSIEQVSQNKEGKISMAYYVPSESGGSMQKRNEIYELFESEEFINVYLNIKT